MAVLKREQQPLDVTNAQRGRAGYADPSGKALSSGPGGIGCILDKMQDRGRAIEVARAFGREGYAPRRPVQQGDTE